MSGDILLCDLDAFFASVEQLDHPEYRGKPVLVGGRPGERGVVATCSYEARKHGVRSAMPMVQAVKLCPDAVFLPVNMDRYRQVSAQVFAVYERFAAQIEKVSIDEAYLAVPSGVGVETARKIREAVRQELDLPVSVGISTNKLLAKMACELAKPDGLYRVAKEDMPKIIWPLPVSKIHGIGPQTKEKLNRIGVKTIGQLAKLPEGELIKMFGVAAGVLLHQRANGNDTREIQVEREIKSIGEEITFPKDVYDKDAVLITLMDLSGQVGYRLRHKGLKARTVTVKIRFGDFSTITRSQSLHDAVEGDGTIYRVVRELFIANCGQPPWRLVGVQVSNLDSYEQLSLFQERDEQVSRVVDKLKDKYGMGVIKRGSLLLSEERKKKQ
ncbi:MAG: DNA polymerase IV [Desulfotomaculaceae bacterium]|nr:DNA polymerase IV [Desulfotomaculaceae bacterium]